MCDNTLKPLPEKWLQIAMDELNEVPDLNETRCKELLKAVSDARPDINLNPDFNFLIRFLRARRFVLEDAKKLLINYYDVMHKEKSVFDNFTPKDCEAVLDNEWVCLLPERDHFGRKITFIDVGHLDLQKYSPFEALKAAVLMLEEASRDEITQVAGIGGIGDCRGFGLQHTRHFSPRLGLLIVNVLQETIPVRFTVIHVVNAPWILSWIVVILRGLMSRKMSDRFKVTTYGYEPLIHEFGADALPEHYGGKIEGTSYKRESIDALLSSQRYFEELLNYGIGNRLNQTSTNS